MDDLTTEHGDAMEQEPAPRRVTRRWFTRAALIAGPASAAALAGAAPAQAASATWDVAGNTGTDPVTQFLGTTDLKELRIRTNNVVRMRIHPAGFGAFGGVPSNTQHLLVSGPRPVALRAVSTAAVGGISGGVVGSGSSFGVEGRTDTPGGVGVQGTTYGDDTTGVIGVAAGTRTKGVWGIAHGTGSIGVAAEAVAVDGIAVSASGGLIGVNATTAGPTGANAVRGTHYGTTGFPVAILGTSQGTAGSIGVSGTGKDSGVRGESDLAGGAAIRGFAVGAALAGKFHGNVEVTGNLTKGSGTFMIDHPLDPANKFLLHSFVESPDMMNVYSGSAVLGEDGSVEVAMPNWFEALNSNFHYQLTAVGAAAPNLHVSREVSDGTFAIAGGPAGLKVSWLVTGVRQDAYANAHRVQVEVDKAEHQRGSYLHPIEHGLPLSAGIDAREPSPIG